MAIKKEHLVYTSDGQGRTTDTLACIRWAEKMGLDTIHDIEIRPFSTTFIPEGYGVYATDAGKAQVANKLRELGVTR